MPLRRGFYPETSEEYLRNGGQARGFRESIPRWFASADVAAALVTQVQTAVAVPFQAGDVISRIAFRIGGTAAGTPTNAYVALYSGAATPALLGQSADTLTAAIAADTFYDQALASPYVVPADGIYYAAMMVKATTVPSLMCSPAGRAAFWGGVGSFTTGQKALAMTSGSGLTGTAPATIASPTNAANIPYAVCR